MTNAPYTNSEHVATEVKSDTHNRFGASVLNWRFTVLRGHGALVAERRAFGLAADDVVQGEVAHLPPDLAHAATAEFLIGNTQNIRMQSGIPLFPRGTGASARAVFALARNRPLGRSATSGRSAQPIVPGPKRFTVAFMLSKTPRVPRIRAASWVALLPL